MKEFFTSILSIDCFIYTEKEKKEKKKTEYQFFDIHNHVSLIHFVIFFFSTKKSKLNCAKKKLYFFFNVQNFLSHFRKVMWRMEMKEVPCNNET